MKMLGIKKQELLLILLGTTLLALGINWFLAPIGLVTGGISGVAIIVKEVSKNTIGFTIPLWATNICLNTPLFLITFKQRGFKFAQKSLYAVLWTSVALWYTDYIPNIFAVEQDILLSALFGGALLGCGIGLVLKSSATTGGTDMLASIIKFKHPRFPITKLMLGIDGVIILGGMFVFGQQKAMYAVLSVFVTTKVIHSILEGMNYAKAAFIVSDKNEEIATAIMEQIPRGVTGLQGRGMYSKDEKEMLFVVVSPKQITNLRDIVQEIDEKAFVTIADVREVLGEGFCTDYNSLAS